LNPPRWSIVSTPSSSKNPISCGYVRPLQTMNPVSMPISLPSSWTATVFACPPARASRS
jgi:hypothetical protein